MQHLILFADQHQWPTLRRDDSARITPTSKCTDSSDGENRTHALPDDFEDCSNSTSPAARLRKFKRSQSV
jgi:hypothetical protein